MKPTDKLPTLSGDFDSTELTENQQRVLDILKGLGKVSLIASKSRAVYTIEKPEGLQTFLRKVQEKVDEGKPYGREEVEELEKEVRYETQEEEIGNQSQFLRVLLGNLTNDQNFQKYLGELVREQMDLSHKRADIRSLAENKMSKEFGV
jgi:hypothetical protein